MHTVGKVLPVQLSALQELKDHSPTHTAMQFAPTHLPGARRQMVGKPWPLMDQ